MTEEFIRERRYFKNVTPATLIWYNSAFKAFSGALDSRATILQRVEELRTRGLSAGSINSHLRVVNAYYRWLHVEHGKPLLRIPKLREEQKLIQALSAEQVTRIVHGKAIGRNESRVRIISVTALDTGMRVQEFLNLRARMWTLTICVSGSTERGTNSALYQ